MSIAILCPGCSTQLNALDTAAGKRVRCPQCQAAMLVPELPPEPAFEVVDEPKPLKKPTPRVKADVFLDDDNEDDRPRRKTKPTAAPGRDPDRMAKQERNYRQARTISVLFILLGGILVLAGFGEAIRDEEGRGPGYRIFVGAFGLVGLCGLVGGTAIWCNSLRWAWLVKVMAWVYVFGFPVGTILSLALMDSLPGYYKTVERRRRDGWGDDDDHDPLAGVPHRHGAPRASLLPFLLVPVVILVLLGLAWSVLSDKPGGKNDGTAGNPPGKFGAPRVGEPERVGRPGVPAGQVGATPPAGAADDWVGQWVYPTARDLPLREGDRTVGTWSVGAGKVVGADGERLLVRLHRTGPSRGWVPKAEVVKLADAVDFFGEKFQADRQDVWALRNRAAAWRQKGEHAKAIEDLDDAVRLQPDAATYTHRGAAWYDQTEYARAIQDFDEAIRLDPQNAAAFCDRGQTWQLLGDSGKAMRDFDAAIRLDPKLAVAFNNRGFVWYTRKEFAKAIQDFDEAVRLGLRHTAVFNNRGNALVELRQFAKAIEDFDEAIRLDPKDARAFNNRGRAWYLRAEYGKAMKDLEEAIRLDPKDAPAFYNKACCNAVQGKTELAIEALRRALEAGWRDFGQIEADGGLDSIRDDPRFQKLVADYMKEPAKK